MLINSKKELNSYINTKLNQVFYTALPIIGDSALTINQAGTAFPCREYQTFVNMLSPAGKFYKFEYILEGKGYLEYDGETYELTAGTFVFIRSNTSFTMYSDKETPMKKHFLGISGKFMEGILSVHKISANVIVIKLDVLNEFENMMNTLKKADQITFQILNTAEIELLKIVQLLDRATTNREFRHATRAENIHSYIEQNLTTELSIEDITTAFFISKSQLLRIFKDKYKTTPMKYVLKRKIDLASYYLKNTDMSISEISDLLCFSDSHNFSAAFKKQMQVSPREYRKKEFYEIAPIINNS